MKKQSYFVAALVAGLAILASGCSRSADNDVAVVDGTPITLEQYHRYLERMPMVKVEGQGSVQQAKVYQTLGFQALQTLIANQMILELAKDAGVLPDKNAIEAELKFQQSLRPDFVTVLQREQGMTLEEIRDELKLDKAKENLITHGITVTKQEALDYIKNHPQQFSVPAQANLLWIVVDSKTKPQVDKELASGQPFGSVAATYSLDKKARGNGGKYEITVIDRMPPVLQDLVEKTPELKATNWIQDHDNWVKFYVQSKTPASLQKPDDAKVEAVRRGIAMQKGSAASDLQARLIERLKSAKIQVNRSPLNDYWKQATQNLAQETAAQATTPGATSKPAPAKTGKK